MRSLGPAGWASHGFFGRGAKTFGNPGGALSGDGYFVNGQGGGPPPGGKVWTTLTTGFETSSDSYFRIYWLNNHWIITTTRNGRVTVIRSTDGIHWAQNVVFVAAFENQTPGASFGAGVYVVTGNELGAVPKLSSSPDLVTWTARATGFSTADTLNDPVFGNGVFLLTSNTTAHYATSANGIAWTQQSTYVPHVWGQPVFDGARFVAPVLGVSSTNKIAVSTDGVNWTESTATLAIAATLLGANASTLYVAGEESDDIGSAVNGALTSAAPISFAAPGAATGWIAYGVGSDWARCSATSASMSSSPNGTSWGLDTVPAAAQFWDNMAWNGTEWIACGFDGGGLNFTATRGP